MKNRIKEIITLNQTKFLNFYHAIYENKLGQEKNWFIASRKNEEIIRRQYFEGQEDQVDAVLIVATHEATGKLVMVRQYRVPLNDYIYELPAGLIDQGEDFRISVARELKEETGLELIAIDEKKSCMKTYLSPGMTDESVAMIYCTCRGELSKEYLEADEDIEPLLLSKEEARELLDRRGKMDIKALIILQQFASA
ncbi:MAG: NUDIX hydrolase [Candidatus Cellulosilyticum pullistercoris]|uniref:NUDIX hydrolase n=1 Tax=Candidatus Cellulosilyticum pullistercoris TaxID=2838521 RepID=A0A9E2NJZ4_9FIRM|nr:NUDIX hydrolase [Candidatus Cellulosilyticum pullistercoris]